MPSLFALFLTTILLTISQASVAGLDTRVDIAIKDKTFKAIDLYENLYISLEHVDDIFLVQSKDEFVKYNPKTHATKNLPQYWLRFTIDNQLLNPVDVYFVYGFFFINLIEMYQQANNAPLLMKRGGTSIPRSQSDANFRKPTMSFTLQPGKNVFYAKISYGSVKPPYLTLHSTSSFIDLARIDTAISFFCFGILSFCIIYNYFVYARLKYPYILSYILITGTGVVTVVSLTGLIAHFLPDSDLSRIIAFMNISSTIVTQYFFLLFAIKFFNLQEKYTFIERVKRINATIVMLCIFAVFCEVVVIGNPSISGDLLPLFALVYMALSITVGIKYWSIGYKPARYYLLSWTPCMISTTFLILVIEEGIGWVETADLWSACGLSFQACFLSLALADRMKNDTDSLHSEREAANESLKKHVEHLDELVSEKTARIRYILDNVTIGIFRFGTNKVIEPEHSKACLSVFEQNIFKGQQLENVLFPQETHHHTSEKHAIMNSTLNAFLNEPEYAWELNSHGMPKEVQINEEKIVELDWTPIVERDKVTGCLVIARDVTYTRKLEHESRMASEEVNLIKRIGRNGRERVVDYLKNEMDLIKKTNITCRAMIEAPTGCYDIRLAISLRNLHTIKGNARTYGFDEISALVHKCETTVKSSANILDSGKIIHTTLLSLNESYQKYLDIINKYIPTTNDSHTQDSDKAMEALASLKELSVDMEKKHHNHITLIRGYIKRQLSTSFDEVLKPIYHDIPRVAENLGKAPPDFVLDGEHLFLKKEYVHKIRSLMIHLVRNAMDHGLESPEERLILGKPFKGTIHVQANMLNDCYRIIFQDDGKGLAIHKIYEKALSKGLISTQGSPTLSEIAELIFLPGFTSKNENESSEISGQGVGMDAVKEDLAELKGDIRILFTDPSIAHIPYNSYKGFYIPFSFILELPHRIFA